MPARSTPTPEPPPCDCVPSNESVRTPPHELSWIAHSVRPLPGPADHWASLVSSGGDLVSQPALQLRSRLPRIADAAIARARLTVVPRTRSKTPRVPFVMLVSMLLLAGVVGLLLFNTSMQQASFAATALDQQATTLSAREQTLKMELDKLRDPQRVAQQAVKLGM